MEWLGVQRWLLVALYVVAALTLPAISSDSDVEYSDDYSMKIEADNSTDTNSTDTTSTTTTNSPSVSTSTPANEIELFQDTIVALNDISSTLDDFTNLLKESGSRSQGRYPSAWWVVEQKATALPSLKTTEENFCKSSDTDDECHQLQEELENIKIQVEILKYETETWNVDYLHDLQEEQQILKDIFSKAEDDSAAFKESVEKKLFNLEVTRVKKVIDEGIAVAENKILELTTPPNTGSVVLVAVIGTFGGLMIVAVLAAVGYTEYKKRSMKNKGGSTPYKAVEGENIAIEAFVSDNPSPNQPDTDSQPTKSNDLYSRPYEYAPKNERYNSQEQPEIPRPVVTRGSGLPRINF